MKAFTVALLALFGGVLPAILADVAFPDKRYVEAYTEFDFQGPVIEIFDYVPDLSVYFVDNAIKSFCWTGSWIFYNGINYVDEFSRKVGVNSCYNGTTYELTSSLRYFGSPFGLNEVYYNLYEGTWFEGAEFRGNTNAATLGALDLRVSSLAITGQSPWTFFTGLDYTGAAVCVYPEYHYYGEDGFVFDYDHIATMNQLDLPDNSIRSVAKGCFSKKIVGMPPSKASPHPKEDHKVINNED